MPIFPKRFRKVAKGLNVWVSNYYMPTQFGVRGRYETSYKLGQYVESGTPGTGFFARTSSSHSYRTFVRGERKKMEPNYLRMLLGRQFSFDREIARATRALHNASDDVQKQILESYINVLEMAMEVEELERMVRAVKDRSRHGRMNRYQTGVLTSFKSRIARLSHDVRAVQMMVKREETEEQYRRFANVVLAFSKASVSHRIWHMDEQGHSTVANQVFFDLGIFDFIQSPLMTPLMRASDGMCYFLYPDYMVASRSATDFDVYPLNGLSFIFRELPYDRILEAMSPSDLHSYHHRHRHRHHPAVNDPDGNLLKPVGVEDMDQEPSERIRMRVVGELYIPELSLRFCSQDVASMHEFVHALNDYKSADNQ